MKKGPFLHKGNARFILTGAALLVVVCAFTVVVSVYFLKFDRTLAAENRTHLAEVADHIAAYTQSIVRDTQVSLAIAADAAAVIAEDDKRLEYLGAVAKRQGFAYIGYAGPDGFLHATEQRMSEDISGEEYYQAAMRGKAYISGLTRRIFDDKAVSGIILAVPYDGQRNGGVLVAMMDINALQSALRVDSFGGAGYSYIIDTQGELVVRSKSMDYNNFYKVLRNVQFAKGYSLEAVRADIRAGKAGLTLYDNLGTAQYAYYRPLGFNDWTIVNIVAKNVVTGNTSALLRDLAFISAAAIIVFFLLLILAVAVFGISENRKRATEAKSAFLANMSHEIRTPLNAIVGISEILLRGGMTSQQRDYVLSIINSGKGLLAIVNDILDISKIEAGKFSITNEDYEVESLLYDVTTIIAVRLGDKPVALLLDIDATLPGHLVGDMTRVKQILINILGNAAKFTERGSIRLTIRCIPQAEDRLLLTIRIADTGIGIRKQDLDSLFVSFNQVDTHHSHTAEGTGLGLAISKKLCEMMGGNIAVESEYGKGSVFTIHIIQGMTDPTPIYHTNEAMRYKILLYEQSDMLRTFYEDCMNRIPVAYQTCACYEDFEQALYQGDYQYALADRLTVRRLTVKGVPEKVHLVTLLNLEEHPLMSMSSTELTVYAPLFSLQLAAILRDGPEKRPAIKRAGIDMTMIYPMPYVHILIVDDNEVNLQVAAGLMNPYDMQLDCVLSGREAIKAVQEKDYDLVMMDHMMPELDGVETTRKIRALPDGKYKVLPIIALTANATHDAQAMFLAEGFDGFLAKPIETIKLNDVLMKWLREINDERAQADPQKETKGKLEKEPIDDDALQFLQTFQAAHEIDFKNGVIRMHGLSAYINVLRTYRKSTAAKLPQLTSLMDEDFDRFVIEIHGLKGASAAISAFGVSELAQGIEQLGKQHDLRNVEILLPAFIERAKKSLYETDEFICAYEQEHSSAAHTVAGQQAGPVPAQALEELEQAFLDYDTERLTTLFDGLSCDGYDRAGAHLVEQLHELFEAYEFEKPLDLIAAYQSARSEGENAR